MGFAPPADSPRPLKPKPAKPTGRVRARSGREPVQDVAHGLHSSPGGAAAWDAGPGGDSPRRPLLRPCGVCVPPSPAVSNTAEETWARGPQAPRAGGQQDETPPSQSRAGAARGQVTQPREACGETAGRDSWAPGQGLEKGGSASPHRTHPRGVAAPGGTPGRAGGRPPGLSAGAFTPGPRGAPHQRVSPSLRVTAAAGCCRRHV